MLINYIIECSKLWIYILKILEQKSMEEQSEKKCEYLRVTGTLWEPKSSFSWDGEHES